MDTLYLILKVLHIFGFATAMGVTLATYVAYNQFWKLYFANRERGLAAFSTVSVLQIFGMTSFLLVLGAGISMLAIANFSFVSLLWFQVKLVLIALLFINGFTLGRTATVRLQSFISGKGGSNDQEVAVVRNSMKRFQAVQLILFAVVVVLSVFRFS